MERVEISKADINLISKYAEEGLSIKEISGILGYAQRTFERRLSDNEEIYNAYLTGRSKAKRKVINALFKKIDEGNTTAIIFYLKTQCKWRDSEEAIKNNSEVVVYLPKKDTRE